MKCPTCGSDHEPISSLYLGTTAEVGPVMELASELMVAHGIDPERATCVQARKALSDAVASRAGVQS